ncbi:MAG: 2-oxoglutarate dehydrogenase E1 component [Bdellovibrionales bacterium]|nr:2-oxoglutarate dehydrogenase E1 component [Bdellovibrionales bacterium]
MLSNSFKFTYLSPQNAEYIEEQFQQYLKSPQAAEPTFRALFEGMELGHELASREYAERAETTRVEPTSLDWDSELKVVRLIDTYREMGRALASIDPLHPAPKTHPQLELAAFGLSTADLPRSFRAAGLISLPAPSPLSQILERLKQTYCSSVAYEISHIANKSARDWVRSKIESGAATKLSPSKEDAKRIFKRLLDSESLERFLGLKFVAAKRFSIEGAESLIPTLDETIEAGAEWGIEEVVLGMAHRGRLNVLVNTFGKKPEYLFTEFEGNYTVDPSEGEGDVKYHKGYSRDWTTRTGKKVHLSLANNPSHLEFVGAVVTGMARAKQQLRSDASHSKVLPIIIHGDAAMAGQGVVYETMNFVGLEGYSTGGTLHIAINNQVGFTTDPKDSRSTTYCTDIGKMLDAPIFHVNGDDVESVIAVTKLALEYRQKFHADVFIDLVCYRKHGHNEGDEPQFTQPVLYKLIKAHDSPREIYGKKIAASGLVSETEQTAVSDSRMAELNEALAIAKKDAPHPHADTLHGRWQGLKRGTENDILESRPKTAVDEATLKFIAEKTNTSPEGFKPHSKLVRFLEERLKSIQEGKGMSWGTGESLAFGSLLLEGHPIRLSGQDAERGTFTHRHAVLSDFETGRKICLLNQMKAGQAQLQVHNSHLSETGVLGFEYGYSSVDPNTLTIWEAQFGDFANGAQVIIDQFISTGESKWSRMSGLVLLLPHGFEGQGPEHSSARLERFLQLSGRGNWTVCNFTTPAQIFHALRRQVKWNFRKPMIIMSPKSLLRHPMAISSLEEFTQGGFQEVMNDPSAASSAAQVERVVLCSGKVYYDLLAEKQAKKHETTALVRVEQLYPWPEKQLESILKKYPNAKDFVWTQEEPKNMGAYWYVCQQEMKLWNGKPLRYAGRAWAASPAVGSPKVHEAEQKALIEETFLRKS